MMAEAGQRLGGQRLMKLVLLVYAAILFLSTHWPRLVIRINDTQSLGDVNLDKPVHALALAVLTALAILARLAPSRPGDGETSPAERWHRHIIAGTLAAGVFAYIDELTQQFCHRITSSADLLADLVGVIVVMVAAMVINRSISAIKRRQAGARLLLALFLPMVFIMAFCPGMAMELPPSPALLPLVAIILGGVAFTLGWMAMPAAVTSPAWLLAITWLTGAALIGALWANGDRQQGILTAMGLSGALVVAMGVLAMRSAQRSVSRWTATLEDQPADTGDVPLTASKPVQQQQKQFVGHARTVSILTLVSRITGLGREAVIAGVFGLSPVAAAFIFAFQIPNLFRRLFGEGALSAAIIPVYAKLLRDEPVIARRFVSLCLALLVVILGVLTLAGEGVLALALTMKNWSPDMALALKLTMIMLPYMPLVCLVAVIGAVLQVKGKFVSTAAAPILLNIIVAGGALWVTQDIDTDAGLVRSIFWVSGCVILAGLLQVAWQVWALLSVEKPTWTFAQTRPAMKSLQAIFLPMVVGLAAFQLNTFLDAVMAMGLSVSPGRTHLGWGGLHIPLPLGEAAVAALNWSQRLYEFPLGIFGIAIATAIFPALSHAAANRAGQGLTHFTNIFHHGLRLSVFIGLPASAGLMIVALPLSRLAYERGEFTLEDSTRVAWILLGYAPAIWAYSMNHVLTRAFYALGDSRTPLRVSLWMVCVNLFLNLILVWPLGAQGFAIATAFGAVLQCVILLRVLSQVAGEPLGKDVWLGWGQSLGATLVMAVVISPPVLLVDVADLSRTHSALMLAGLVIAGGSVYAGAAWMLRCEELGWLLRRKTV